MNRIARPSARFLALRQRDDATEKEEEEPSVRPHCGSLIWSGAARPCNPIWRRRQKQMKRTLRTCTKRGLHYISQSTQRAPRARGPVLLLIESGAPGAATEVNGRRETKRTAIIALSKKNRRYRSCTVVYSGDANTGLLRLYRACEEQFLEHILLLSRP